MTLALKAGDLTTYELEQRQDQKSRLDGERKNNLSEEAKEIITILRDALPIRVTKSLRNPHTLIEKTEEAIKKARPDQHGMLSTWADGTLNVSVGPDSVHRALRIMDAIVKFLESQHLQLVLEKINRKKPHQSSYLKKQYHLESRIDPAAMNENYLKKNIFGANGTLFLKAN